MSATILDPAEMRQAPEAPTAQRSWLPPPTLQGHQAPWCSAGSYECPAPSASSRFHESPRTVISVPATTEASCCSTTVLLDTNHAWQGRLQQAASMMHDRMGLGMLAAESS